MTNFSHESAILALSNRMEGPDPLFVSREKNTMTMVSMWAIKLEQLKSTAALKHECFDVLNYKSVYTLLAQGASLLGVVSIFLQPGK